MKKEKEKMYNGDKLIIMLAQVIDQYNSYYNTKTSGIHGFEFVLIVPRNYSLSYVSV